METVSDMYRNLPSLDSANANPSSDWKHKILKYLSVVLKALQLIQIFLHSCLVTSLILPHHFETMRPKKYIDFNFNGE